MKIVFVSSEVSPFSKTGGLADVAGALPKEIAAFNNDIIIITPLYGSVDEEKFEIDKQAPVAEFSVSILEKSHSVRLFKSKLPGSKVKIYFIDSPHYFHRDTFYTGDHDEDERFIYFSKAVINALIKLKFAPDIIHCNDWHAGLIPVLVKENFKNEKVFRKTAFVFTIHNIAFQGMFGKSAVAKAGLSEDLYYPMSGIEYYDTVNFLKAGITYSEVINTVSETYAMEILTEEFGAGMENVLLERKNDLFGIINGVDYSVWSPENDKFISQNYSYYDLELKEKNKIKLLEVFNLPYKKNMPVIGFVARLTDQKGFDLISRVLDDLLKLDVQWIFLGSGFPSYENLLLKTAEKCPDKFAALVGFDNQAAHLIEAGADIFMMPSRFEPCGLNQIYSLRYGTPPVARNTGGLADTITDWHEAMLYGAKSGTGFLFDDYTPEALAEAIKKAVALFDNAEDWDQIKRNGMRKNFSWKISAEKYVELYNTAINRKKRKEKSR